MHPVSTITSFCVLDESHLKRGFTYHFLPVLPTYSEEERGGEGGGGGGGEGRGGRGEEGEEEKEKEEEGGGRKGGGGGGRRMWREGGYKTQHRFIMLFAWVLY